MQGKLTQAHLVVYQELMRSRRHFIEDDLLPVAGKARDITALYPGDLEFIKVEAEKLLSMYKPVSAKEPKVAKEKLEESDLTV